LDTREFGEREVGVDALVNMSQLTVSQMSIQNTTPSPQQRQHWLCEQALSWSGLLEGLNKVSKVFPQLSNDVL
jgi:hypothetical protein